MTQKKLSLWLKVIIIAMAVAGLVLFGVFVPLVGIDMVDGGLLTEKAAWCWLEFILPMAVPCYLVLFWCWNASADIGANRSFTRKNAQRLRDIMFACLVTTVYLFIVNLVFFLVNASTALIFACLFFIDFIGAVLAVASGCLSHLVYKAALIREENEQFI